MLHLVVMAGGSGTRFWPESRRVRPKQFLTLSGTESLIQQAAHRVRPLIDAAQTWVVTGGAHADETARQLPEIPANQILHEPCGRNTAPCIGLAAMAILQKDPDAIVLVTPADHIIQPEQAFRDTVARATTLVGENPQASVLIGIKPTYAATGYGYIERGDATGDGYQVAQFREKPAKEIAEQYLQTGRFYWNSGIFVWKASRIIELLQLHQPAICDRLDALQPAWGTSSWGSTLSAEFPRMPSISIDYAVLEPAASAGTVFVLPASFGWDDVGSWQSLPAVLGKDADGNTTAGLTCSLNSTGCVIRSSNDHLIAAIGLEDLVVVHTPDATLVAPRDDENALRKLVALLEEKGLRHYL